MTDIPGWESIMLGIKGTLGGFGYKTLLIDYERTPHGFDGIVGETEVLLGIQPAKAEELAARITFLTQHLPDLRVIITGESNGASIADDALRLLAEIPRCLPSRPDRLYGTPAWSSRAHWLSKITANKRTPFPMGTSYSSCAPTSSPPSVSIMGPQGNILLYIGAPGHYYQLGLCGWCARQIERFLDGIICSCACMSRFRV